MKSTLIIIGSLALIALAVWIVVAPAGPSLPDPETAEVSKIQETLASDSFAAMKPEARQAYMDQLRALPSERRREIYRMEGASDETKKKARQVQRDTRGEQMTAEVEGFFKLSAEEQTAFLDQKIQEMDQRRAEWQKRREERQKEGDTEARPERKAEDGKGKEGRKRPSPDAMQKRMEERLSEHTPEERAMRSEYFRRLMERYRETHPNDTSPFGGRGGGGGWGGPQGGRG